MNSQTRNAALLVCALASTAGAQATPKTFDLPTVIPIPKADNKPFASQRMRYQQWYSAAEVRAGTGGNPVRIVALEFKAGSPGGQVGRTIELEVAMANSNPTFSTASFDSNMVSGRTTVFPRGPAVLGNAVGFPLTLSFQNEFIWDGQSGVVVDIKLFDNGNNNTAYPFDLELSIVNTGRIDRMWTANDIGASFAQVHQQGEGITTRFHFLEALSIPYGTGCPGDGGHIPVASTSGGHPTAGNFLWTQELSNAPSQRPALFVFGGNRDQWLTLSLPHEMLEIGGVGCFLRAKPLITVGMTTVGGGAGTGLVSLPTPLPPVTFYVGQSFFSQWIVLDPNALNGVLTVSPGLRHIMGL